MRKPVIALPADIVSHGNAVWHAAQDQYIAAALRVAGVMGVVVPAFEQDGDVEAVLDRVDGVLVTGAISNVHPGLYGAEASADGGPFDPARDATAIALIRGALAREMPLLAICRGLQELNVALGGTLASEIQDLPGNWDHRAPEGPARDALFAIRQPVVVKPDSCLATALGFSGEIAVNSLHRQAIGKTAPGLQVEATAPDGTIEAVSVIGAKNFAIGLQWHPEYWAESDAPSRAIFENFGSAVRAFAQTRGRTGVVD